MTALMDRERVSSDDPDFLDTLPRWVRAMLAALGAAGLSLALVVLPVVLAWMTSSYATGTGWQAVQVGVNGWLLSHAVPISIGSASVSMTPWLLSLVPLAALVWLAQWAFADTDDESVRDRLVVVIPFVLTYAVVGLLGRLLSATEWMSADLVQAPLRTALFAAVAVGIALSWTGRRLPLSRSARSAWQSLPLWLRRGVGPGVLGVGVFLGVCALLVLLVVLVRWPRVSGMYGGIDAGPVGVLVLTLGQLLYLPTAAVWAASWVCGAGFGVGVDASVTWSVSEPGVIPAIPFLGALPEPGPIGAPAWLAVLVPLATGAFIAWRALRGLTKFAAWHVKASAAGVCVAVAGVLLALAGVMASGSLGAARLSYLGVPPYFGLVVTIELFLGAALYVAATELKLRRGL